MPLTPDLRAEKSPEVPWTESSWVSGLLASPSRHSPTRVDFLDGVVVVADVFAQAAGGVEGLFALPTRVPLQHLQVVTESEASEP